MIPEHIIKTISDESLSRISEVCIKHGIHCVYETQTTKNEFTIKIVLLDNAVESKEESDFKHFAPLYGLEASFLGKKFSNARGTKFFKIIGLRPSRRKNCIMLSDTNGKVYVTSPQEIKDAAKSGRLYGP